MQTICILYNDIYVYPEFTKAKKNIGLLWHKRQPGLTSQLWTDSNIQADVVVIKTAIKGV